MGKKPGWFRRIFGGKKTNDSSKASGEPSTKPTKAKNQWSFPPPPPPPPSSYAAESPYRSTIDASKHAIVVAAATAAVAEAALAAAKAAAEVVRLTSGGGGAGRCTPTAYVSGSCRYWEVVAAVKIQSAFRAYLARRALRALKALVKLQALVRGHIVRKQTADTLRRMQALVRVQVRARASRAHMSESSQSSRKSFLPHHLGSASPFKYEHQLHSNSTKFDRPSILRRYGSNSRTRDIDLDKMHYGSKWLDRWMKETSLKVAADEKETDKILEMDAWKPHLNSKQSDRTFQISHHNLPSGYYDQSFMPFHSPSTTKARNHIPNIPFGDSISVSSLKFHTEKDEATSWTAENSPQVFSASSRPGSSPKRSAFSPTRSEFSRSSIYGYSDHPNYMSNTESYRAKVRSQSAPRQRIELDKYGSTRRSVHGFSNIMTRNKDYADSCH